MNAGVGLRRWTNNEEIHTNLPQLRNSLGDFGPVIPSPYKPYEFIVVGKIRRK